MPTSPLPPHMMLMLMLLHPFSYDKCLQKHHSPEKNDDPWQPSVAFRQLPATAMFSALSVFPHSIVYATNRYKLLRKMSSNITLPGVDTEKYQLMAEHGQVMQLL